jgi:serine/threonine protein kinase
MTATVQLNQSLSGRYRVDRAIGKGGMATVYLAHDLRHGRKVALKVLRPELCAALGVERFLAEIRVMAKLQHPNLLPLFDSGEVDGLPFFVMPYVEGDSLRELLSRQKQLSVDAAVTIATAVASAVDYAHRHNVVHRDLKPANILLHDGQPLVADFGIALAVTNAGGARITQTGISLGTPQYMSPEQVTADRELDGRSDIYSLGVIVYEMLLGEAPFSGPTAQAVFAKMLSGKPPRIRLAREAVPEHVEIATARALERLPADRFATARDFADALLGKAVSLPRGIVTPASVHSENGRRTWRARLQTPLGLSIAAVCVGTAAVVGWTVARLEAEPPILRLSLGLPPEVTMHSVSLAISDDGGAVVYNGGTASGALQLYVRRLGDLNPRVLAKMVALDPAISPNGRWVTYTSGTQLWKIPIDGGRSSPLGSAGMLGSTWLDDDNVVAVRDRTLWLFPTDGSGARRLTALDTAVGEREHVYPVSAGDGRHLLFHRVANESVVPFIGILNVATGRSSRLDLQGSAVGLIDDVLVYADNNGVLTGVHVDLPNQRRVGQAIPLGEQVSVAMATARVALSRTGTLVYQVPTILGQLALVDSRGATRPLLSESRAYRMPRYSPDGRRVAMTVDEDVWVYDLASRTLTRLTTVGANDRPEWTPDSKRVLYRTTREGDQNLWWQSADGGGTPSRLMSVEDGPQEGVISPDGKSLIVRTIGSRTLRDIQFVRLNGDVIDTVLHPIAVSEFEELQPRLSWDGKWVAYMSNESGINEVYVRAFPGPAGKTQVSTGGGSEPVWSRDGRTLYYRRGREMFAATIATSPMFTVLDRKKLFEGDFVSNAIHADYDVSPDGKELLMVARSGPGSQVIVVFNWARDVRQRMRLRR